MNRFIMIQLFVFGNDVNEDVYIWTSKMCIPGLLSSRVSKCRTWIDIWFFSSSFNFNCGFKIWTVQPPAVHPICRSKNQRRWRRWRTCLRGIETLRSKVVLVQKMSDWCFSSDISCWCDNCVYLYLMFDVSLLFVSFFCFFFLVCPSFFRSVFGPMLSVR